MKRVHRCALLASALSLMPAASTAQTARTAVVPDSITVGSVFRVAIRLSVPAGTRAMFPDTLRVPENVEAAARRLIDVDSSTAGEYTYTAVYPLTAWKPGPVRLDPALVRTESAGRSSRIEATFPEVRIQSVLPQDSAGIEPKPAKDVLGPSRLMWPMVLAAFLVVALIVAAIVLWRRRRKPSPLQPATPPRELALVELERIRRQGWLERGEWKMFYSAVSGVLRRYAAALEAEWGRDLTTTELGAAMGARLTRAAPEHGTGGDRLIALLGGADLVKFAARRPSRPEAEEAWTESLGWVETFDWPEPGPAVETVESK